MRDRLPLIFIFATITIDAMGIGLIVPVMPDLLQQVQGADLSLAAKWGGVLATSFAVMQFLFSPLLGNLSDRFGRRPVLLVSLAVMAADYMVMALAHSIWLLLIARIVGGITAATSSTATAYLADISAPEQKAARFGLIGAAFGLGFVIGPVIGGLLGELGPRAPFWAAAGIALANLLLGLIALPETLPANKRRRFEWTRANPLGAFRAMSALPGLRQLLGLSFLYEFAYGVYPAVWAYFTQLRFGWEPRTIGPSLAVFGLSMAICQGALIRPILKRLGERYTAMLGFVISTIAMAAMAFVTQSALAFALIPLGALGAVTGPALQGMMSRRAAASQQGELQGAVSSARAIAMILSPLVMTQSFALFTHADTPLFFPGAPFVVAAAVMALCALGLSTMRRAGI
ncbi:major facilitator superfamily protein [Actibacterium atlanticum]|uniref:Major facilitator superfamily protein n=1 Tax=Actibacterium atlanticum TaxID=1461693 RepID=A0A058ZL47_9RHOB|nr:tetracycline resistance MFS efflux pump [Actibacterium atlanticum]KCV81945.1 major facilitator superfamily protein [Actibacterium atlanticum]